MSDNYIIEIRPPSIGVALQAGIVVREGQRFQFFAATPVFNTLEGRYFNSLKKAEAAALNRIAEIAARKTGAAGAPSAHQSASE